MIVETSNSTAHKSQTVHIKINSCAFNAKLSETHANTVPHHKYNNCNCKHCLEDIFIEVWATIKQLTVN